MLQNHKRVPYKIQFLLNHSLMVPDFDLKKCHERDLVTPVDFHQQLNEYLLCWQNLFEWAGEASLNLVACYGVNFCHEKIEQADVLKFVARFTGTHHKESEKYLNRTGANWHHIAVIICQEVFEHVEQWSIMRRAEIPSFFFQEPFNIEWITEDPLAPSDSAYLAFAIKRFGQDLANDYFGGFPSIFFPFGRLEGLVDWSNLRQKLEAELVQYYSRNPDPLERENAGVYIHSNEDQKPEIPELFKPSKKDWVKATLLAGLRNPDKPESAVKTLSDYRTRRSFFQENFGGFGIDKDGRKWRTDSSGDVWYVRETLTLKDLNLLKRYS